MAKAQTVPAKTTKTTKTNNASTTEAVATKASTAKTSKATKASKGSKSVKAVKEATPAPVPVVEETSAQEPESVRDAVTKIFDDLTKSERSLNQQLNEYHKLVQTSRRDALKHVNRLETECKKYRKRRHRTTSSHGIRKPQLMNDSLCDFLGLDHGSTLERTEVTKRLCAYAKEHCTKDKKEARKFVPDAKMASLLGLKKGEAIEYISGLQQRIKAQNLLSKVEA